MSRNLSRNLSHNLSHNLGHNLSHNLPLFKPLSPIVSCNVKKRKVSMYYKRPISVKHVVRLPTFSLVLYFKCCWKMGCFCDSSPLIWFLLRFSFFSVYVCYCRHIKEICDALLISYSYIWLINFKGIFIPFSFHWKIKICLRFK